MNPGLRLVRTWTDLECGCCVSDRGSWIVTTSCEEHVWLIPAGAGAAKSWPFSAPGIDYGPFVPEVRDPARPRDTAAGEGLLRPDPAAASPV